MNPQLADITSRIAALTSIHRTTNLDAERLTTNGGSPNELRQRHLEAAVALRKIAADLEKPLA